jgi:hypothetical protein
MARPSPRLAGVGAPAGPGEVEFLQGSPSGPVGRAEEGDPVEIADGDVNPGDRCPSGLCGAHLARDELLQRDEDEAPGLQCGDSRAQGRNRL